MYYNGFVGAPRNNYRGKTWRYTGPVYRQGYPIGTFTGDTKAFTAEKALENLTFRARRECGSTADDISIQLDMRYIGPKY